MKYYIGVTNCASVAERCPDSSAPASKVSWKTVVLSAVYLALWQLHHTNTAQKKRPLVPVLLNRKPQGVPSCFTDHFDWIIYQSGGVKLKYTVGQNLEKVADQH